MSPFEDLFENLERWIDLESVAESKRLAERKRRLTGKNAERSGEALLDLVITDHETGLGGRYLVTLIKRNRELDLPWNRLRVGSPVVLSAQDDDTEDSLQAVVSRRSSGSIQLAVNEWPDGTVFRIDLSPDEITRRRQLNALKQAQASRGRQAELRKVLLAESEPRFGKEAELEFFSDLNESQQSAIQFAMAAEDLAIIHGPPGTGKTTTVVELIRQAIRKDQKVLACAPSNTAVDNILERLAKTGVNVIRLGHPARVDEELRQFTLDLSVQTHENMKIVRDMMREAEQLYRKASRFTRAKPERGAKQEMRRDAKRLRSDARLLEQQAVEHLLDRADVVCATTTLDEELLAGHKFDLTIIDEACQCTEPACWVPIMRSEKIVLAGDHCQLPPTVVSREAANEGFETSLLERLVDHYGPTITRRLDVQYRMHQQIMNFSSQIFYDGSLSAHESVKEHLLHDLDGFHSDSISKAPVSFFDSAGADWDEELEPDGESRLNPSEGQLVLKKANELQQAGLAPTKIAIIAPYAAQVRWLRENASHTHLEIDTVDGFQGREKEAVLISLVRSNERGEIGFLGDTRRMNVALTRARRKLIVVGDSATIGGHEFYAKLLEYFESIGAYHSVWEEMD